MFSFYAQVTKAHSWTCMDLYVFATPYRVTWDYYFLSREHTLDFSEWESAAEYEYVSWFYLYLEPWLVGLRLSMIGFLGNL